MVSTREKVLFFKIWNFIQFIYHLFTKFYLYFIHLKLLFQYYKYFLQLFSLCICYLFLQNRIYKIYLPFFNFSYHPLSCLFSTYFFKFLFPIYLGSSTSHGYHCKNSVFVHITIYPGNMSDLSPPTFAHCSSYICSLLYPFIFLLVYQIQSFTINSHSINLPIQFRACVL